LTRTTAGKFRAAYLPPKAGRVNAWLGCSLKRNLVVRGSSHRSKNHTTTLRWPHPHHVTHGASSKAHPSSFYPWSGRRSEGYFLNCHRHGSGRHGRVQSGFGHLLEHATPNGQRLPAKNYQAKVTPHQGMGMPPVLAQEAKK
jgi:hypothetical protein